MTNHEAIQFLDNMKHEEAGRAIGKDGFYAELMGYHVQALNMAIIALSRSENPNKWIPVSERLPKDDTEVLITYIYSGHEIVNVAWINNREWYYGNDILLSDVKVIAWMPLPEPYKAIPTSCSTCILDNTDACTRGAGRAVDDESCEDYLASPTGAESEVSDADRN